MPAREPTAGVRNKLRDELEHAFNIKPKREYDPKNYPNRDFVPAPRKKLVYLLIKRLLELDRSSHPDGGKDTAINKDRAAFDALSCAGRLVKALAGWAIDHQVGLAIKELSYVPWQPSGTREHPEYLAAKARVDSHVHEQIGGRAVQNDLTPIEIRHLLLNLLRTGVLPAPLFGLQEGLEALDFGERGPIFEPAKSSEKVRLSEMRLQLEALCFVEYRVKMGLKKGEAQDKVATALGVAIPTLRSWEYRLYRQKLNSLAVARKLSFARNEASYHRKFQATDKSRERYNDAALGLFAAEYNKAKRERQRRAMR